MSTGSPATPASEFGRLCEIVAQLRAPGGCPWDREQTKESLVPALLEEAYEVAGAISAGDHVNLREELGDLLLVIVMEAEIAAEEKCFSINEVVCEVTEKLIRRHPHVFGESTLGDTDGVVKQWESIKRAEKKENGGHYLATIPAALPALMRAQKAQKKAARVHFDWPRTDEVLAKVHEELREAEEAVASEDAKAIADEIGDLLFAVTNLARKLELDAETLLQRATDKFVRRFNELENRLQSRGGKLGEVELSELDLIWEEIKAARQS